MSTTDPHDAFDQLLADWLRIENQGKSDAEDQAFVRAVLDRWQQSQASALPDDEALIDDPRRRMPVAGISPVAETDPSKVNGAPDLRLSEPRIASQQVNDAPHWSGDRLAAFGRTTWRRYATAACLALIGLLAVVFIISALNRPQPSPTMLATPYNLEPPAAAATATAAWAGVVAEVNWLNERPEAIRQGVRQLLSGVDVVEIVQTLQPSIGTGVDHQGPMNWQEVRSWLREQAD